MRRLVLWDIDHTLIDSDAISSRLFATAFTTLTGRGPVHLVAMAGRTDREITKLVFAAHGLPEPPWAQVDAALEAAGLALAGLLANQGRPLPGAAECLRELAGRTEVVQSLLTGNIRANARVKLAAFGLDALVDLSVGGYGGDGVVRADLVGLARTRAESAYRTRFGAKDTVLVGDTPRDVEAGRVGGARVIAVATGRYSVADLREAGATVVLPDLRDTGRLVSAVLGAPGG